MYLASLYSAHAGIRSQAANRAAHFALHNVLVMAFVHLYVRGVFFLAEPVLVLDFLNLVIAYRRFPFRRLVVVVVAGGRGGAASSSSSSSRGANNARPSAAAPLLIHAAALAVPYAWSFVALFWAGGAMLHTSGRGAAPFANVAVWGWLVFGAVHVLGQRDWVLGVCMSVLCAALGVQQLAIRGLPLQWEFAFGIMALLFVGSVVVAGYDIAAEAKQLANGHLTTNGAGETAPLLRGEA